MTAAYVLHCSSLEEAGAVVARDPLVGSGLCQPKIVRWDLVGINRAAINPDL